MQAQPKLKLILKLKPGSSFSVAYPAETETGTGTSFVGFSFVHPAKTESDTETETESDSEYTEHTTESDTEQNKMDAIEYQKFLSKLFPSKYIDKKNGLVEIDVVSDGRYWKFSIRDNGIGIHEKYFDKIFKVFQVLQEGENSTGVGLSIVKKIVNFYNGNI